MAPLLGMGRGGGRMPATCVSVDDKRSFEVLFGNLELNFGLDPAESEPV